MVMEWIKTKGLALSGMLVILLLGLYAHGQTPTASVSGVVRDDNNGAISRVRITVRNAATGTSRITLTDDQGRYRLVNLDPGTYELRAEHEGFTGEKNELVLTVGSSVVLDLALHSGEVHEMVILVQKTTLIDPTKAELSRVVTQRSIDSLPILGRNFVDFTKLSSGVAQGRENTGGGAFKEPDIGIGAAAAPRLTFGGQSELTTKILIDGVDNVQTFTGLPRVTPSQEAAQEFRILNNTYLAEYGGSRSGFVNIVTKSGTNQFHGSLYYYGMNNALSAKPALTGPDPVLRQNQFGATLGGPIRQDRTFWFGNYEGQRRAESNKFSQVILNNLAAINAVKSFYGLAPEASDLLRSNDYHSLLGKLDHQLSENNYLSFRYDLVDSQTEGFLGGGGRASPASSTARNNNTNDQSFVASDTAILHRHLVNEARFQWGRRSFDFPSVLKQPDLEVSNLILTGKSTSDMDFYSETRTQLSDTVNVNLGEHEMKLGVDFNHLQDNSQWDLFFPGRVIFPDLTSFLNHTPAVFWFPYLKGAPVYPGLNVPFTQDVPDAWAPFTHTSLSHNTYGFFLQDQWRVFSPFTLTYGVRYDFETYPDRLGLHSDLNNFQPRIGFAWAYNSHGVLRAGFGLFNDRRVSSIGQTIDNVEWLSVGNQPNAASLFPGVAPINGRFIQPTIKGPGAITATQQFLTTGQVPSLATLPTGFSTSLDSNLRTPYSEQGSLKISQEVGNGVALSASYLYVHGLSIGAYTPMLNGVQTLTLPSGKPVFGSRLFPELGDFFMISSGGLSIYHGGTLEIEKRFTRGMSFAGSYTYSKTISNTDSLANLADFPEGPGESERALSRQNVPHRFTLAFISEVPKSVRLLHQFKFSSLVSLESGRPYNIFAGSDANRDGNPLSDRPGSLGRNSLQGPGYASFDVRVSRPIQLRERLRVELSADMFNVLNRLNIKDLNTLYGNTDPSLPPNPLLGFGTPRDAYNPFQVQYSIKLEF